MKDLNDATTAEVSRYQARQELVQAALGYVSSQLYAEMHPDYAYNDASADLHEDHLVEAAMALACASGFVLAVAQDGSMRAFPNDMLAMKGGAYPDLLRDVAWGEKITAWGEKANG